MFSSFRARISHLYCFRLTDCNVRISNAVQNVSKLYSCNINTHANSIQTIPHQNETVLENNEDESETFGLLNTPLEESKSFRRLKRDKGSKKVLPSKTKKSDTFGTLSDNKIVWYPEMNEESKEDNDPSDDSVVIRNISKRYKCQITYFNEMKRLVKEKKLKEALDLFPDMRRNYVKPTHGHYTFMISTCGKVGYTDMAFQLFRQMTDRGYKPTPATLTGLFNSCAESPFPADALKSALNLKEKIKSKNWQLTQITYHAMIKAFGKCGDIVTAFQIVDEMAKAKVKIDVVTYSFLLISCISNKEAGFTHAVEVWRKMKAKKCSPNLFTCNLLLRAVRDCEAGPEEISNLLLQHWSSYSSRPYGFETKGKIKSEKEILLLENAQNGTETNPVNNTNTEHRSIKGTNVSRDKFDKMGLSNNSEEEILVINDSKEIEPINLQHFDASLLDARPRKGPEILELGSISSRSDRLTLIGGVEGFLKFMANANVKPNIVTFTLLLENLPSNTESEENLISQLDACQVQPDIDFFNMLIKKRNFRNDNKAAHRVLLLISKYSLTPDIMTFGVLALGCQSYNQALVLINDMKKFGISPSIAIVDALVQKARRAMNFKYLKTVLELMMEEEIQPDTHFLKMMEKFLKTTRTNIINMEHGTKVANVYYQDNFQEQFRLFCSFYEEWLKSMNVDMEKHPWDQYATNIIVRTKDELIR